MYDRQYEQQNICIVVCVITRHGLGRLVAVAKTNMKIHHKDNTSFCTLKLTVIAYRQQAK